MLMHVVQWDLEPSEWVQRWASLIPEGGLVLDLACGGGRHARYLAALGYSVVAVDRDELALASLHSVARVKAMAVDLEAGAWPLAGRQFGGIVVTNYLHRPLFPNLLAALGSSGVLIYETFGVGNERFGKPSNPAFLLRDGELLDAVQGHLRVVAYEALQCTAPRPAVIQRICATRTESSP
ncbi:MAG: methyltransferase domain-containing protein [Burkholderiales bacterium]